MASRSNGQSATFVQTDISHQHLAEFMRFCTDINGPQRIKFTYFGHPCHQQVDIFVFNLNIFYNYWIKTDDIFVVPRG